MTEERKQELFPYFAYIQSQKLNPDKYGKASIEEWQSLIQESPEDVEKIIHAAEEMTDDDWNTIDREYTEQTENAVQFAAKGAKLKKLKSMKKSKKCKCGCDIVSVKAAGGKMVDRCACGCGVKKHKKGGALQKEQSGGEVPNQVGVVAKKGNKIDRISKAQKGKSIKKPIPQKHDKGGGDETWVSSNVGVGDNSMNPKDWSEKKKKAIEQSAAKEKIKSKVEPKITTPKKAKGGFINKYEYGGVSKINEVRKAQQDARKFQKPTQSNFVAGAERINTKTVNTKTVNSSNFKQVKADIERLQKNPYAFVNASKIPSQKIVNTQLNQPDASIEIGKLSTPKVLSEPTPNVNISVVDYLASKGMAFDKASRARYARELGVDNYNYSADANNRLLNALKSYKGAKPLEKLNVSSIGVNSGFKPIQVKPVFKRGGLIEKYKLGDSLRYHPAKMSLRGKPLKDQLVTLKKSKGELALEDGMRYETFHRASQEKAEATDLKNEAARKQAIINQPSNKPGPLSEYVAKKKRAEKGKAEIMPVGKIKIDKCGGKTKAPDRVKKAKLKK